MTHERFIELYDKSRNGGLSASETIEWNEWIGQSEQYREMVEDIQNEERLKNKVRLATKAKEEDWQEILEQHPELRRETAVIAFINPRRLIRRWTAVAAAAFFVIITSWWLINYKEPKQQLITPDTKQAFAIQPPDTTRATITLANGQVVALDTLTNGVLAIQGKVNVVRTSDGQIAYKGLKGKEGSGEVDYNTLTNPRGSRIVSINLSDGTTIWLNSESILRYPVVFNGNERRVELTGEAYFEVAPSFIKSGKKRPFYVTANDVTVEVLGTHYNINSYPDENSTKVTLLEGSVKVSTKGEDKTVILKPGEQTSVSHLSQPSQPIPVQTEEVMAWKNNTFYFNGENLQAIMNQLARYYDVDVEYEGNVPNKQFGGMISRTKSLNEVLNVLELSGVHFRVEGQKIIVLKN